MRPEPLTAGQRFDRLTVIDPNAWIIHKRDGRPSGTARERGAVCRCDCGAVKTLAAYALTHGEVRSCGCWSRDRSHAQLSDPDFQRGLGGNPWRRSAEVRAAARVARMARLQEIMAAEPGLRTAEVAERMNLRPTTIRKYRRLIAGAAP